ncbi:MAG: hypothetical protein AAGN15_21520 [Cyanobacteria bacterium J06581_3]
MENGIEFVIEGSGATEAAEVLLAMDGVSGEVETDDEVTRDGGLTAVATIVGIVGGTVALAEQIRQWYVAYKKRQDQQTIEKVLIITPKGRFLLENATVEQISKALEPLAK